MKKKRNIVYSTDKGRLDPQAETGEKRHEGDSIVRLQRQSKGRAGKPVVIVSGLAGTDAELKTIAKQLKKKCGVGGTVESGTIVMQGDHRDVIKKELERAGHTVKISGG